jgi:hypothetical protein
MLSGVVAEGDVAKESIWEMSDSHNVKCGDFVIGESLSRY